MARIASLLLLAGFTAGLVGCGGPPATTATPSTPAPGPSPTTAAKPTELSTPAKPDEPAKADKDKLSADAVATVRGGITHPGKPGQTLTVGYVELTGEEWLGEAVPLPLPKPDDLGVQVEGGTKPRLAILAVEKGATKYEFPHLPKGKYLLFARLAGGPTAWTTVEVKPGTDVTHDFKLEAGKGGTVEVTTPADFTGEVRLAPNALIPAEDTLFVGGRVATQLEIGGKADKGKVTATDVPPGKYTLYTIPGNLTPRGTVEVTAGKTATVELEKEKEKK